MMRKTVIYLSVFLLGIGGLKVCAQQKTNTLTDQEVRDAVNLLLTTRNDFLSSVNGLSDQQLNFKASPEKWSIRECALHLAAAEKELWAMAEKNIMEKPNPELRSEIQFTDKDLIAAVEDRSHKSKTFAALEPTNSPYHTLSEALAAFKRDRQKLIDFTKSSKVDLRNHVLILPLGKYDAYQFILLIAAHSNRHTQQIIEVKNSPNFPKS